MSGATTEGEKLLASAMPLGNDVDDEFLGRLSEEERALFTQRVRIIFSNPITLYYSVLINDSE